MANSNVKGVTLGSSGLIARSRIRLQGLYYVAQQSGNIILLDRGSGGGGGTTSLTIHVAGSTSAQTVDVRIPNNGVLFEASAYAQITGASSVTFWVEGL